MNKKKLLEQLERAIEKEERAPNAAKAMFVNEFVDVVRAHHERGEVLVSTRDVMRALGCGPDDVVSCMPELRAAGVDFHHTDIVDQSLPTIESRGDRFSFIGAALAKGRARS